MKILWVFLKWRNVPLLSQRTEWLLSYLILWSHFVRSLFAYPARFITCWDLLYKRGWGGPYWVLRVDPSSQVEINNHWDTTPTPQKLLQRLGWLNKLLNQPDFSRQTVNDNNCSSDGHQQKYVKFRQAPKQESLCSWHKDVLDQTDVSPSYHLRVKRVGPKTYIICPGTWTLVLGAYSTITCSITLKGID